LRKINTCFSEIALVADLMKAFIGTIFEKQKHLDLIKSDAQMFSI
jgi:hypothetical protein